MHLTARERYGSESVSLSNVIEASDKSTPTAFRREAARTPEEAARTDAKAFRDGVGRLRAEVQRIKSEGDYDAARTRFETYGIHFDPGLRDEVLARVAQLELPAYTGFVMPRLEPIRWPDGRITDVTISYPRDPNRQMLEYSANRPS
ncbi:MAG TPA: hypothetical protein VKP69_24895, partial [Isosphaeraceae bacterium]|nr:hypothetical protein [Isosphaeraceae bacterium]